MQNAQSGFSRPRMGQCNSGDNGKVLVTLKDVLLRGGHLPVPRMFGAKPQEYCQTWTLAEPSDSQTDLDGYLNGFYSGTTISQKLR